MSKNDRWQTAVESIERIQARIETELKQINSNITGL